jgi:type IV pilus assembly protein PilA
MTLRPHFHPTWRDSPARGRIQRRAGTSGFTLVELMIVVAIIGVLAALAIYGVTEYFASAKTAEAKNTVGAISRAAASAFEREVAASELLAAGAAGSVNASALCGTATNPIPKAGIPAGNKLNPDPADQVESDPKNGWTCLRFSMSQPVLYQYMYQKDAAISAGKQGAPSYASPFFEASAVGDIDKDGVLSTFARGGQVDANRRLTLATLVFSDAEYE